MILLAMPIVYSRLPDAIVRARAGEPHKTVATYQRMARESLIDGQLDNRHLRIQFSGTCALLLTSCIALVAVDARALESTGTGKSSRPIFA